MDSLELNKERFMSDLEQLFDAIKETEKQKDDVMSRLNEIQNLLDEEVYFGTQLESQIEGKDAEIKNLREQLDAVTKKHDEMQWYFGELNAKKELVEGAVKGLEQSNCDMEIEINNLRAERDSLRKDVDEARWLLGEARARVEQGAAA
jgi:chromosome segregation ATPase